MAKKLEIRNSTDEFLIFQIEGNESGVQVVYHEESVWCTQKTMAQLFDCSSDNIGLQLKNIYETGELTREATTENFSVVQTEGERQVNRSLTDIYATAIDYNRDSPATRLFFKKVQNKMHGAVHSHTAAELIVERANAEKEHMGLTTWENAPDGKIVKPDVSIAKNYLKEMELADMGRLVNAVLDMAERMAQRHIPMTMEDWAKRIDIILEASGDAVLTDAGKITAEFAKSFAESEFEKYSIIQDKLFQSDFDRFNDDNLLPSESE